jgi:xylan 1,4-beta-xylosidase
VVVSFGQNCSFYIAATPEAWQVVAQVVDGRIFSTPLAGGFVGAYIKIGSKL